MEELKHECGVAMIRLLKPTEYYAQKYGTQAYGLNKLYLMMEKQHNRGQEGAGIAAVNLTTPPGQEYMFRRRAEGKDAITEIFRPTPALMEGSTETPPPVGGGWEGATLLMGHLRYSTTGKRGLQYVHPFLRRNNWRARNLCLCGHRLDREVERCYEEARQKGLEDQHITQYIDEHVDVARVLRQTMALLDGGYVMCGMTGSGELFAMRDPWGIRPAFYYRDDEVMVVASERPVIQTCFDVPTEAVGELPPGQAIIVGRNGHIRMEQILPAQPLAACSFERIYFSRGSDRDIYLERKRLGQQLAPAIINAVRGDMENTVCSFIPNTAEVAFYGMVEGIRRLGHDVRSEKVAWKDIKLRTFITEAAARTDLASHVYDITYGALRPGRDNLVVIDDSIVRGTTLRESIFKMLDRLHPRKIVMVSSSPQIRYPDYYGIDMARLEELCAFRAAVSLIRERGMEQLVDSTYAACRAELQKPKDAIHNCVRDIYAPFTVGELSRRIADMLRPDGMQAPVELVFQSIEGLREAIPRHPGDWYFTGHYPTPGGRRLVCQAFINFIEADPYFSRRLAR